MRNRDSGLVLGAAMLAVAIMAIPSTAGAQSTTAPWLPFMGCWIDVEAPANGPMTCVVPAEGGAEILTVAQAGVVERQLLRADGVERPFESGGCEGVQSAEASADGDRIYTRSTLSCEGGTERSTRGIIAMAGPTDWVDVRALTVGDGSVSWVKRYTVASARRVAAAELTAGERAELERAASGRELAIETARMTAASAPTVEDIIDAHARTDPEAVRAWIAEQGAPIDLNGEKLIQLADAGVRREVIDVAVAVSYPERFALARQSDPRLNQGDRFGDRRYGADRRYDWDRYRFGSWHYDPFYYDPYYSNRYYYGRSAYGSGFGYGPGYGSYGQGWYGRGPGVIVVRPADEAVRQGRLIKGEGYRAGSGSSSAPRATPSRPSNSGSGAVSPSRGSTTPTASPPRTSSGSKGKAKPKGGGGG